MTRFLSLLGIALLLAFAAACHHGDDDHGSPLPNPMPPVPVKCYPWDGDGPTIEVERPISDHDRAHLKICVRQDKTYMHDHDHRAGCYYGCPFWKDSEKDDDHG